MLGAKVIATGRSDEKLALVKSHGADHVINTRGTDYPSGVRSFRDEVKALTDGPGVDAVYDAVGGDISLESLRCVAFGARFLIVGWTSPPNVADGKGPARLAPRQPATDQPDPDERPHRDGLPGGHHGGTFAASA